MTGAAPSSFTELIDVSAGEGRDRFVGPAAPERGGRIYGGQLLAQAVASAYCTVDDGRRLHSVHALFLRAGDVDQPTAWEIDRLRDGRSFAVRAALARQGESELFRALLSFHTPEPGLEYQPPGSVTPADLEPPDRVPTTYVEFCRAHPDFDPSRWYGQDRPMEIRYLDPPSPAGGPPTVAPQRTWTRVTGELPEDPVADPVAHHAALAYLSDATLIDHALLPHGHRWNDARLTGASLDHVIWFHRPARADRWLLFDQRVEWTGGGRGLASGRLYTGDGELAATCTQEGLIRWSEPDRS